MDLTSFAVLLHMADVARKSKGSVELMPHVLVIEVEYNRPVQQHLMRASVMSPKLYLPAPATGKLVDSFHPDGRYGDCFLNPHWFVAYQWKAKRSKVATFSFPRQKRRFWT